MIIYLNNAEQGEKAIKSLWFKCLPYLEDGGKLVIIAEKQKRGQEQNEKYHSMIGQIAKQAQHLGAQWSAEEWKRLLVSQFAKETGLTGGRIVPSLDGQGIVQLDFQTRRFTVKQASEFIEWLYAWGAQNGVEFKEMI